MIDFHTHILPGIDDGSRSVKESLGLLREEAEQGVTVAALTPHYYAPENSPEQFMVRRQAAWEKLAPHLTGEHPRLLLGAEVLYFEGITAVEEILRLRLEGTPYLLLEMPFCDWSARMVDDVIELNSQPDTQVVLAHFERYRSFVPKDLWKTLQDHQIWLQSNVSFFCNWKTRGKALAMLKRGDIHFVGSDCHNLTSRPPRWQELSQKAVLYAETCPGAKALEPMLQAVTL